MPRKVTIPIYDGDDFERLAELRREVSIAERKAQEERRRAESDNAPRRMGDDDDAAVAVREAEEYVKRAQDAYDAFVDEAADRAEMWVLHPIGHEEWRDLLKAHPPRKVTETDAEGKEREETHPDDLGYEVNTETFPKALLLFVDPDDEEIRTVHEPFESVAALRKRVKRLSAGEFESIWTTAYMLNSGVAADPKLSRFSPAGRKSDAT